MTRAEILAFNAGLAALAAVSAASADALRVRLVEKPTRYTFAIEALEGIVEAAADLMLPLPPDGADPAAGGAPLPPAPAPIASGAAVVGGVA
jgi:hypothetical protein